MMFKAHAALQYIIIMIILISVVNAKSLRNHDRRLAQSENLTASPIPGLHTSINLGTGISSCYGTQQEAILDIYFSTAGNSDLPTTTVLHLPGGAYMNLVPDTIEKAGIDYLNAGYTLAVLYYRLPRSSTEKSWLICSDPWDAIVDVSAAMKVLRDGADIYRVDPNQIVISGFSAGGHLAALYGSTCEARWSCPRSLVLHFPFLETGAKIFCSNIGSSFSNIQDYNDCFPTTLVDKAMPPTVLYHASGDTIVSTDEMTAFVQSMSVQGVAHEYYEVPGGGHFLVPFQQVVDASAGTLGGDTYAALIEKSLDMPSPECSRCDDIPSKWMIDNGKSCGIEEWSVQNRCNTSVSWVEDGYCRQSCFDYGKGYTDEICCEPKTENNHPSMHPSTSSCIECSDIPPQFILDLHKTCATATYSIKKNCIDNSWWVENNLCQKSCDAAGRGYPGIKCC